MRYLALATVIVVAVIVVLVNVPHAPRVPPPERVHFSSSSATPGPGEVVASHATPGAVVGTAPWALSALPGCFHQDAHRKGVPAVARLGIPASAKLLVGGTKLHVADCAVEIGAETIVVRRGSDRMVIPRIAHLYGVKGGVVLDRQAGGVEDVRVYSYAGTVY